MQKTKLATNVDGWAPVPGFNNISAHINGSVRNDMTGIIFRPRLCPAGYHRINIWHEGKHTTIKIHRLVALAHIPNSDKKPYINHINGVKTDNSVENLEWVTPKENAQHAYKIGLVDPTIASVASVDITRKSIILMGNNVLKVFRGLQAVADYLSVSEKTVRRYIKSGKNLKGHVVAFYG